ncbi:type II toxin-antitoxin system Phd/YefM family antitoxin [Fimbriimonas ginsengisoli]|nr:hypothetical protein [Fimbriimonas ginsengisoli]
MIRVSAKELHDRTQELLASVRSGETVEVTESEQTIARILPVEKSYLELRIQEMARQGLLRLPLQPFDPDSMRPIELKSGQNLNLVEALIEDREDRC